jgi:hypothetical protein
MAAEATFTLRAVDATKQAFASVQNSLQNIKNSAQTVSRNFATSFGFQAAITAARKLNQVMKDAEETGTKGGLIDKDTLDGIQIYNDVIKKGSENFQYSVGKAIGFFQDAFSYTKQLFTGQEKVTNSQKAQNIALENAKIPLGIINEKLTQQVIQNELINAGDNQILDNLKEQVQAIIYKGKMSDDIVFKKQAELDAAIATGQVLSMEKKMAEDQKNSLKESKKLHDDLNASIGIEFDVTQRSNELLKERALLNEKIYFMDKTSSKGKDDVKELKKQRDDISKDLIPLLEKRYTLEKQIGEVVGQNFQNAILEGGKAIDVVKAMVKEIISLIFYQMVTRRIASGITGLLIGNPLVGSIVGAPMVAGAKAEGGPVGFGKSYLVGERGPELFVPHASGSIVSNSNMNQGGGSSGASINVNYNIAAGVTRSELAPILEQERRRLKAEIPDMVRRGGAYRSAFA